MCLSLAEGWSFSRDTLVFFTIKLHPPYHVIIIKSGLKHRLTNTYIVPLSDGEQAVL